LDLCASLGDIDPLRFLFPEKREFTYLPNAVADANHSQIDLELISGTFLETYKKCKVSHHLDANFMTSNWFAFPSIT
jgi:hypothetical protein